MEALKVTLYLSSPLLIDSEYPMHLDAIIASVVCKQAEANGSATPWTDADDLSLYLDKTTGDNWVWKASRLMFTPLTGISFQNQIRKSDPDRYFDDLGVYWAGRKFSEERPLGSINPNSFKIDTRSGQERGYLWLTASQHMSKAEAWVIGDKDAIEDALSSITHIGKMNRNDYGRVDGFTVETTTEVDKWAIRMLPLEYPGMDGVEYAEVNNCLRAPYWKDINRRQVKEPIV